MPELGPLEPAPLRLNGRSRWWRRHGTPKTGFHYTDEAGKPIPPGIVEGRIKQLAIPPAWNSVHICPHPTGRLQAVGLDGSGKAQYLYHPEVQARKRHSRFAKVEHLGEHLPKLRRATRQHLKLSGLPQERVLALLTRLIDQLNFRVGCEENTRTHHTYGLTTLRKRHVRIHADGRAEFLFQGKHHVKTRRFVTEAQIVATLRLLKQQPGSKLFQYEGRDGRLHAVLGRDLNAYIKRFTAPEFTAKDFRTWAGTMAVATELTNLPTPRNPRERKRYFLLAVKAAAERLGNTPAVCRRAYLHPVIEKLYEQDVTLEDVDPLPGSQSTPELRLLGLFEMARQPRRFARRSLNGASGYAAAMAPRSNA